MLRIVFAVETTSTGFSGAVVAPDKGLPLLVTSDTFLGFQKEAEEAIGFHTEVEEEDEPEYFKEIREGKYEIVYQLAVRDLLNAYSVIIGQSGLAEITGISNSQFWRYQHGDVTPRPKQKAKIEEALHKFGENLQRVEII